MLGSIMFEGNVSVQGANSPSLPNTGKKRFLPIIIIAVLVSLCGISAYLVFGLGKSPTKVAKSFIYSLSGKDLKAAYAMTSSQFQSTVTLLDLEKFLIQYPILKTVSSVKLPIKVVKDNVAKVSGELNSKDGKSSPITLVVVKESSKWRVLNLSLNPEDVPNKTPNKAPSKAPSRAPSKDLDKPKKK